MLALTVHYNNRVVFTCPDGTAITIEMKQLRGRRATLLIDAPRAVSIHRESLSEAVNRKATKS